MIGMAAELTRLNLKIVQADVERDRSGDRLMNGRRRELN